MEYKNKKYRIASTGKLYKIQQRREEVEDRRSAMRGTGKFFWFDISKPRPDKDSVIQEFNHLVESEFGNWSTLTD